MSTTADSTPLDDTVIDGLRPQARRYDVAVSDGLVLAVLPNGSKTWTWVYEGPGQPHRQTLGVYPEMSFEQARQALESAAETRRQRGAPAAYVIRDGRIEPLDRAIEWKWPLAGALALAAVGVAMGWWLLGDSNPAPDFAARESPGETLTLEPRLDADRVPASTPSPPTTPVVSPAPAAGAPPEPEPTPTVAAAPETADTTPVVSPTPAAVAPPEPEPRPTFAAAPETADATPVVSPTPAAVAPPEPEPTPTVAAAPETADATPVAPPTPAAVAPPEPEPTPTVAAAPETADTPAGNTAGRVVGARIGAGSDFQPGVADARVARAQITSAMVGREPADTLGPVLAGTGEAIQTYYFFTELRSLAGQRVRHRWIAGDRIQAEIPFNVGEAWRWRIFSSKRLLASMAGPWRVQIVTDDDTVIYDYAFEFQP